MRILPAASFLYRHGHPCRLINCPYCIRIRRASKPPSHRLRPAAHNLAVRGADRAGLLMPEMDKSDLFPSIIRSGPLPKKSFSIGPARDKRYYLECRRIK